MVNHILDEEWTAICGRCGSSFEHLERPSEISLRAGSFCPDCTGTMKGILNWTLKHKSKLTGEFLKILETACFSRDAFGGYAIYPEDVELAIFQTIETVEKIHKSKE